MAEVSFTPVIPRVIPSDKMNDKPRPLGRGKSLRQKDCFPLRCPPPVNFLNMRSRSRFLPRCRRRASKVEFKNRRTSVVRPLPNGFQERKLKRLANTSAKLFNEINYERRQQFFQRQRVDFKGTCDKYYEKYKGVLGVNAQAIMQKNNGAWNSTPSLLKLKKEGRKTSAT